jgi:succinate dehydrogenase/fumarate reductase cytochrome b subunit
MSEKSDLTARREKQRFWTGVQGASALVFSTYLAPHLGNTISAIAGPSRYDAYIVASRAVFRQPLIETAILGSIAVHLIAGWAKNAQDTPAEAEAKKNEPWLSARSVHRVTGYVLAMIIGVHVWATRLSFPPPYFFNGLAFTMERLLPMFLPYYTIFGCCAAVHMLGGFRKSVLQVRAAWPSVGGIIANVTPTRIPKAVIALVSVAITAGVLAFTGLLFPVVIDRSDPSIANFYNTYGPLLTKLGL